MFLENIKILVTGGAGFIGSALIRKIIKDTSATVVNVDKLTYAGNLSNLEDVRTDGRHHFEKADISSTREIERIFNQYRPDAVIHLAAESHVDRSIENARAFIQTNVVGTYVLLETCLNYWKTLKVHAREKFRFHHVSTDEVFGSLGKTGLFTEQSPYQPSSPYSASKASSDHLVRSWHRTFGLPVLVTNCSNNYGARQYPEKLIPLIIQKALKQEAIPVYGEGDNIRDWLYVDDHAEALTVVLTKGEVGETYNIGGLNEMTNLEVVKTVCRLFDELRPLPSGKPHMSLITFVEDRPGHDRRYAMDTKKIESKLGWKPKETFESGLRKTVLWYLQNQDWCRAVTKNNHPGRRLGLAI